MVVSGIVIQLGSTKMLHGRNITHTRDNQNVRG